MNCDAAQDSLLLEMAGELETHERKALEQHLVQCAVCTKLADELDRTQDLVHKAIRTSVQAPENLNFRVMEAVRRLPKQRTTRLLLQNAFPRHPRLAPAFAALACLFAGYLLGFWHAHHTWNHRVRAGNVLQNLNWNNEEIARIRRAKVRNFPAYPFRRPKPRKA